MRKLLTIYKLKALLTWEKLTIRYQRFRLRMLDRKIDRGERKLARGESELLLRSEGNDE